MTKQMEIWMHPEQEKPREEVRTGWENLTFR